MVSKKFELLSLKNYLEEEDNDNAVFVEIKKDDGLLFFVEDLLNSLGEYDFFESELINKGLRGREGYDKLYDSISKHNYFCRKNFNVHLIKQKDSLIIIFEPKKLINNDIIQKIREYIE